MDHGWDLPSDSETGDEYKISLDPDFRYPSLVTCHVTLNLAKKVVIIKLNGAISLYVIWMELDETYPMIHVSRSAKSKVKVMASQISKSGRICHLSRPRIWIMRGN